MRTEDAYGTAQYIAGVYSQRRHTTGMVTTTAGKQAGPGTNGIETKTSIETEDVLWPVPRVLQHKTTSKASTYHVSVTRATRLTTDLPAPPQL